MIDQVVIATDASLGVLYNNYDERFYNKIMSKIVHIVDLPCNELEQTRQQQQE